jgi:cell wall-associated NlpC family hydrolase
LPSDDLLNSGSRRNPDVASTPDSLDRGRSGANHLVDPGVGASSSAGSKAFGATVHAPRRLRSRGALGVLLSAALVGSAVFASPSATAAPEPTVGQVQRKIERLRDQAEKASEAFNETREELKSVNVRLKAARTKLARQRTELGKAKAKVGQLASETYRRGQLSALDLMLGDDPDSALAQAGYLPSLGERQTSAMNRLQDGEKKLAATEAEIKQQLAKVQAGRARLQKTRATVKKRLKQADAQLRTMTVSERAAFRGSGGGLPAGEAGAFCKDKVADAPSSAAKAAISFGCAQIGDPYLWAAAGPDRWDCSGFTMKAYAAGGVSLPHSSRLQAGYGTSVSSSSLLAGDLVFFHNPISHVGIYLGGGMMVHAPSSGSVVQVSGMYASPTTAVRLG